MDLIYVFAICHERTFQANQFLQWKALKAALGKLGYKAYHMGDNMKLGHDQYWRAGFMTESSNGNAEKLGKEEFDRLLTGYNVR